MFPLKIVIFHSYVSLPAGISNYAVSPDDTVDGCEILHQLIGGKHPIIYRLSTILLMMQDFFHSQYGISRDIPSGKLT